MLDNSSSDVPDPDFPSNHTETSYSICHISRPSSLMYAAFYITNILVLGPLCIFILYHGLQQWRRRRSDSTAAAMSHSDCFTYHMVAMELIGAFGFILCSCGVFMVYGDIYLVGYHLWTFTWYGEIFFNLLTCVERYLAVVHPIVYLRLRSESGIRIRNICIGCVWLLSSGGAYFIILKHIAPQVNISLYCLFLIVITYCSLMVLHVLIRPRPGEQGRERETGDRSKQRAFYTIVAILGVLLIRFVWNMVQSSIYLSKDLICLAMGSGVWFNFPMSLVLPLLFLCRVRVFACCRAKK